MQRDWTAITKGMLRAEMTRRGLTYQDLAGKLAEIGVKETETNLRTKISRGSFTAVFFIQCLTAIGCSSLRLDDLAREGVDTEI
jgi:hypothetical protein